MSFHDTLRSGEFPDIIVASLFAVETGFDAVTFIFDFRKFEVDLGGDAGYIKASNI